MGNIGGFWANQGNFNQPVIQTTPGENPKPPPNSTLPGATPPAVATPNPVDLIPGTAQVGTNIDPLVSEANDVNPLFNATTNPLTNSPAGTPAGFNLPPDQLDPTVFEQWNSLYQIEYLAQHEPTTGTDLSVEIGQNFAGPPTPPPQPIHVLLSSDQSKAFILENLQLTDLAQMSVADQNLVSKTTFFTDTLAGQLGLLDPSTATPTNPAGLPATQASVAAIIQNIMDNTIKKKDPNLNPPPGTTGPYLMTEADVTVFTDELKNLQTQAGNSNIINLSQIQSEADAIVSRFTNAAALGSIPKSQTPPTLTTPTPTPPPIPDPNLPSNLQAPADPHQFVFVDSLDNNQTVTTGYQQIMTAERQIAQIQKDTQSVAQSGTLPNSNQALDAPDLIAFFMLKMKETNDATNIERTQIINQQNAVLACYTLMQQMIQQTEGAIGSGSDPNKDLFTIGGLQIGKLPASLPSLSDGTNHDEGNTPTTQDLATPTSSHGLGFSPQQMAVLSMFQKGFPSLANPMETLDNVSRPPITLMSQPQAGDPHQLFNPRLHNPETFGQLTGMTKAQWDAANTALSDTVSQMQQQQSIASQKVSETQQVGDQEFSFANSALSKQLDLIETLGRGYS